MASLSTISFPFFDHVKFENRVNGYIPPLLKNFEYIDELFSLSKTSHTVELSKETTSADDPFNVLSLEIFHEDHDFEWCELATKITLWVLSILTVIPMIALLVTKALYQQEIMKIVTGETPSNVLLNP